MSTISTNTFKKNVGKVTNFKQSRTGLKFTAKSAKYTAIAEIGIATSISAIDALTSLHHYVLGMQMTPEMKMNATGAFGLLGANIVMLSKLLKTKMPSST
jgi:hypothetical protein